MPTWLQRSERFIVSWWWVLLCALVCYGACEHVLRSRDREYRVLFTQLEALKVEKLLALDLQADLQLQIHSHSDPKWVELTLMKVLGLVPEGQTKVFLAPIKETR